MGHGWEKVTPTLEELPLKGDTVVGNDVWIGQNVTVLPAVATSMVPAVSEAFAQRDRHLLTNRINHGVRAGAIISFPCTAGTARSPAQGYKEFDLASFEVSLFLC